LLTRRKLLSAVLVFVAVAAAFVFGQVDVATKSIHFDLRTIGQSLYEARSTIGRWPAEIEDLEGTAYLRMPYRKTMLEDAVFVVVWQQDLDLDPQANRDRVLAYDNGSLFSRLGWIWVCRGDLRIERMGARQLAELTGRPRQAGKR
jgi:hypothetical protein